MSILNTTPLELQVLNESKKKVDSFKKRIQQETERFADQLKKFTDQLKKEEESLNEKLSLVAKAKVDYTTVTFNEDSIELK